MSDPVRILASCKINKRESFRIEVSVHSGTTVVSLRRYKSTASGIERPAGSGLAISAGKFGLFNTLVAEAHAELKKACLIVAAEQVGTVTAIELGRLNYRERRVR
jgi:hypothetical protein